MDAFEKELVALMPKLRRYALSLVRDPVRAEDLMQDTLLKALEQRDKFQQGTNLSAWVFTIQRNLFISSMRGAKNKPHADVMDPDVFIKLTTPPMQEAGIHAAELRRWLALMPAKSQRILSMVAEDVSYNEIAAKQNVSIGTVKSRISRARDWLEPFL